MAKIIVEEKNAKTDGSAKSTYLTEMKELPPETGETENVNKEVKQMVVSIPKVSEPPKKETSSIISEISEDMEENAERKLPISAKDAILGIVNLISVILLILILIEFPKKAQELKNLRVEEFQLQQGTSSASGEIEEAKSKVETLEKLFLDDSGIVDYVNAIERIKGEDQVITRMSFANQKAIKDKTGNFGLPVVIELAGSWENIDKSLGKIDALPFFVRPVKADIGRSKDDPSVIVFKYGVFLYVNDKLGESR